MPGPICESASAIAVRSAEESSPQLRAPLIWQARSASRATRRLTRGSTESKVKTALLWARGSASSCSAPSLPARASAFRPATSRRRRLAFSSEAARLASADVGVRIDVGFAARVRRCLVTGLGLEARALAGAFGALVAAAIRASPLCAAASRRRRRAAAPRCTQ